MRFEDLVEDPAGNEQTEDAVLVGEADEDSEDDEMHDALGILPVVHGSDAGDESEERGEAWVRFPGDGRWRDGTGGDVRGISAGGGSGVGVTRRGRSGSGQSGDQAGFAEDSRANGAGALLAERFAAVLAKGSTFTIRMVCAVHTSPPFSVRLKTLGEKTTRGFMEAN